MSTSTVRSNPPADDVDFYRALLYALLVWGVAYAYTFARYAIFGLVSTDQAFLYLGNKSLGLTGVALFTLSFFVARRGRLPLAGQLGAIGSALACVHVAASLTLLAAGAFSKLHLVGGRLTTSAQLTLLAGALAVGILCWQQSRQAQANSYRVHLSILALVVAHVTALGWVGWLQPAGWHGGLPPISLLSALIGVAGVALGLGLRGPEERQ